MGGTFDFTVAGAPPPPLPADYVVNSDAELTTTLALGAATLSGKIIEMAYQSAATFTMSSARTYSPPLTIRALNASCGFSVLKFTASVNNIEFNGCNFQVQPWPKVEPSAIRFSSGLSTGLNFTDCLFYHGYGEAHDPIIPTGDYSDLTDPVTGTGFGNSVAGAFSKAGGGAGGQGKIISCTFDSLRNADVSFFTRHLFDCDIRGIYEDVGGTAFYTDGIPMIYARCRIQRGFATTADFGGPHCDAYQQLVAGSVLDQLWFVGVYYYGTHEVGFQGVFLSDESGAGGYKNVIVLGCIFTGRNVNQIRFGAGGGTGNGFNVAFGNTVVDPFGDGEADTNISFSNPTSRPSYQGYNLITGTQAESAGLGTFGDSIVNAGNLATKLPNYANMRLATSAAEILAAVVSPESAGADWARQFIDWTTTDPTLVIKWDLLPAMIDYVAVTGSATSTVITTPIQKVKGYIPTATDLAVVPDSGVEWTTFSDEAGTVTVRAWGTGTGVVRRGHTMQMRKASPGTGATAFTIGALINGYQVTANYTTA